MISLSHCLNLVNDFAIRGQGFKVPKICHHNLSTEVGCHVKMTWKKGLDMVCDYEYTVWIMPPPTIDGTPGFAVVKPWMWGFGWAYAYPFPHISPHPREFPSSSLVTESRPKFLTLRFKS